MIKILGQNFLYNKYLKLKKKFIETKKLRLDTSKFVKIIGFKPKWNIKNSLKYTYGI